MRTLTLAEGDARALADHLQAALPIMVAGRLGDYLETLDYRIIVAECVEDANSDEADRLDAVNAPLRDRVVRFRANLAKWLKLTIEVAWPDMLRAVAADVALPSIDPMGQEGDDHAVIPPATDAA
jgi:hypothetical protein